MSQINRAPQTRVNRRIAGAFGLLTLLGGCASYHPSALDLTPPLRESLVDLRHPGVTLPTPLTVPAIAYLAVENNPDLRAFRARIGVAEAQVLLVGLLPNPRIGGSFTPVLGGPPPTFTAFSASLSEDVQALITLSARREAARSSERAIHADVLWQEWQVIGKARLLAVDLLEGERQRRLLTQSRDLLDGRYDRTRKALAQGNAILTSVTPDLVALQAVETRLRTLARLQQSRWHQLDALLGLEADVRFKLPRTLDLPPIDEAAVRRMLVLLPDRRPDLIALRLGYQAEEATVRAAILAQFPALVVGIVGGRDVSDVRTLGPTVSMDLPIFNHNQGGIAVARATRARLREEFHARLATADGKVEAALADIAQLRQQIGLVRGQLARAERVAREAETAFRAGNLDERAYVDLVITRLDDQQELVGLEQSLLDLQIATATLVGAGMPLVVIPRARAVS